MNNFDFTVHQEFKNKKFLINVREVNEKLNNISLEFKDTDYENKPDIARMAGRFSGSYFTPTFIKSFMTCPAKCFLSGFDKKEDSPILNLGSATHKIYERIVNEKTQDLKRINEIKEEEFINFNLQEKQREDLDLYVNNFAKFEDWNGKHIDLNDNIGRFTEHFLRDELNIMDVDLGTCLCLIDRIDIDVENKLITVIDYKTGKPVSGLDKIIDSYKNQLIVYSWMVKKKFGFVVQCFIYLTYNNTYVKVDIDDLEDQSNLIDIICDYYDYIKEQNELGVFYETVSEKCKYCNLRDSCLAFTTDKKIENKTDTISKHYEWE